MAKKTQEYEYHKLADLQSDRKVNVYGVVKFVKPPFKSRGTDYCITLSITDSSFESSDQKLKCNLFGKEESHLPLVRVGEIVRFHRLFISKFNKELQGCSSPGLSWLIFSGSKDDPLEPRTFSSNSYSYTDKDKEIVKKLREWTADKGDLQEEMTKFEDISAGAYFDTVCQVVCTAVAEPNICMLLRVWDGTQIFHDVRKADNATLTEVKYSVVLRGRSADFLYDVFVFDDHFHSAADVKPGDYVKFNNLHAAKWTPKNQNNSHRPGVFPVELNLHKGNSYGRSLRVISPDSSLGRSLKRRLEKVPIYDEDDSNNMELEIGGHWDKDSNAANDPLDLSKKIGKKNTNDSDETTGVKTRSADHGVVIDSQIPSTSAVQKNLTKGQNRNTSNNCDPQNQSSSGNGPKQKPDQVNSELDSAQSDMVNVVPAIDTNNVIDQSVSDTPLSGEPRCMLQTAAITLNHPHIKPSKISHVLDHKVPYKFRLRARIVDYFPKPTDVETFLQLYCSNCHYLCPLPRKDCNESENSGNSELPIGSTFNGVMHYNCPRCFENRDNMTELESPPHLQFIYMMRFLLKDDTGMLMANIWKTEAEVFFHNIGPEKLLQSTNQLTQVRELLNIICPEEVAMETKPLIECCIRSFSVAAETRYQIFDTAVV